MKKIILAIISATLLFTIQSTLATPTNLVVNGDFETPEVTNSSKWQVFSSDAVPGWTVEWAAEYSGAPDPANLELHEGVLMSAYDGDQSVEMDTDWSSANGEPASVKIYQDIETCVGGEYTLSYAWSPRPRHNNNAMEVYWNGSLVGSHSGSTSGWNLETITGLTASGATTRIEFIETGNPDSLGMFLDAVSVEQTKDCLLREAEITSPAAGDTIVGSVDFTAYLIDDDQDPVQWAVRKGTCAMGQGTVLGNVDGHNDPYTWTYDSGTHTHTFLATADTCAWEPGDYCFVFNPKEDSGESDIRLTREFIVASCDEDGDGIDNNEDMCLGTGADVPEEELGTNRWIWDGTDWITNKPKGKGKGLDRDFTIEQTNGCSCFQILYWLNENYLAEYGEMNGHWKFGCSKSVIEDFISLTD
ncbi:DUF642 domain-containing protein [Patescibacteria group bacterium]|nr:DUF642 domain-containing protein [Patescibacteria group bacterium]